MLTIDQPSHRIGLAPTLRQPRYLLVLIMLAVLPSASYAQYTEKFETWSAGSANTWETKVLSGAPFNVPANAVVEIALRNNNSINEMSAGVRATGSTLDRRLSIHEAEGNGLDVLVMHVQADASSQIQHYAENTTTLQFILLGYWTSGTYVERFDMFTAGASASWQDQDLCAFGVGPQHVAEIVMTNDDPANEREAGVRTNGSTLARRVNIHKAEAGGVDVATMFVKADATAKATIELYAQDDLDIDFYLVGYWSVAPRAYTELFTDVGSPTADATWQDLDLTASGVPDDALAEFVLTNDAVAAHNDIGVRANGSSLGRFLGLHEAEDGGSDLGRMHVLTDATATIEFYHENISDAHTFYLIGYWDTCDTSIEYVVSDLGAVTATFSSLALHINSSEKVAGFDEDASGDPDAWYLSCGSFTSLGVLGGSDAEAHGINDNDMVVGWSDDGSGNRRAYTWTSGGGMTDLGTVAGRTDTEALSVNNNSEVVGTAVDFDAAVSDRHRLAFLYLPSAAYTLSAGMNSLGTLGGFESVAMDINNSGQVVGGAQNSDGNFRPFRWANGTMTDLGTLGGQNFRVDSRGEAINSSGKVAGRAFTPAGGGHAFFWDGSMTDLGVLTGVGSSWAFGLNDSDIVIGTSETTGGVFHAFVWDSTNGMRDLNNLVSGTWTLTRAMDINNDGSIVGFGTNPSGDTRAFLLTPTCNNAGGGAAAASIGGPISFGAGEIDSAGQFQEIAFSADGNAFAEIVVVGAEVGVSIEYTVTQAAPDAGGRTLPAPGTLDGFADGIALGSALQVVTPLEPGSFKATVSLKTHLDELDDLDVSAGEMQLHVLDTDQGSPPGRWIPAGKNIGQASESGILGESGYSVARDGTVDYWAVRDEFGTFAVGKLDDGTSQTTDSSGPARLCGLGMLPFTLLAVSLLLARWTQPHRQRFGV